MALYSKINLSVLLVFIFIWIDHSSIAQNTPDYWQVDYGIGSIIKHKKLIAHLVTAHPHFASISWQKNADTKTPWKQRYNYPDWGLSVSFQDFNNPNLGKVFGIQYQTTYYLLNRNAKNQLNLQVRTGLAYDTSPLDLESNNKNVAMSSNIQLAEFFKLEYNYPILGERCHFQAGLLLTHYSNASYKNPNFGINSLFINLGLRYQEKQSLHYPKKAKRESIPKEKLHYSVSFNLGIHESKAGLGDKPVYAISVYTHKKIGQKSFLQSGLDFFNSQAVKALAEFRYHTQIEYPNRELLDHKQLGLFVGHELVFNKISLETNVGYYLYHPLMNTPSVYQKIGLKHPLYSNTVALDLTLKVHNFKAEYVMLGIVYSPKKK